MTVIDFNEIRYSLGWEDDLGYCMAPGPWDQFYNTKTLESPDNKEKDYLIRVFIDDYTDDDSEVGKLTVEIDDHDKVLNSRVYDLKKLKWSNDYIKSTIQTVSDMFVYLYITPDHLTTGGIQDMIKRLGFIKHSDYDEAEEWWNFENGPICLYTYCMTFDYYKPESIRQAKVIDTFEYDPDNTYTYDKIMLPTYYKDHWKCTYKDCNNIDELERSLTAAYEKFKKLQQLLLR